jgi:hypothetical protein
VFEDGLFKWSVWVKLKTGEARREAEHFLDVDNSKGEEGGGPMVGFCGG